VVGDSVRFSLHRLADIRLGKIRHVMQSNGRIFRQDLSAEIMSQAHIPVVPAFRSEGIAINSDKNLRINQVQILGIDNRFTALWDKPLRAPGADEAVISRNVAGRLGLKTGDDLLLRIQNHGKAPLDAPFVSEKEPSVAIRVKISAIAADERMGRFSLKSNQTAPFNVFLSLKQMASLLELPGYANLMVTTDEGNYLSDANILDSALQNCWQPADAGLHFVPHPDGRKSPDSMAYQLTSDRIFFDDSTARVIRSTVPGCQPILTYLVNAISSGPAATPYSFVTAADESFLKQPLGRNGVIVNEWLAKDLAVARGDSVMMRYFLIGPLRRLREDSTRFMVSSVIPMTHELSDASLMPDFPGMSDAGNCRDWETGAPVNLKNIRDKDEAYWQKFRGTPKAFISLETGQNIWHNRFGNVTAFRFHAREKDLPNIEKAMMSHMRPVRSGLSFTPVYMEGKLAAENSTDFGELFLGLSFFILVSALLLTGLLFYLLAEMRMAETGILSAIGFSKPKILGILAGEAVILTLAGVLAGLLTGVFYNDILILGLNTVWRDAVNTSLLVMDVRTNALMTAAFAGTITAMSALLLVLWLNLRKPLSVLVKSNPGFRMADAGKNKSTFHLVVAGLSAGLSMATMTWMLVSDSASHGSLPLVAGGLMLPGGIALLNLFLVRTSRKTGHAISGFWQLTMKNLALQRSRVMPAVTLLSLGVFTLVITGANKKTLSGLENERSSGTGGFLIWAESSLPILQDLSTNHGAAMYGMQDDPVLRKVRFVQLTGVEGEDASCLNLNQVSRPAILGVPVRLFDSLGAFSMVNLVAGVDAKHPWRSLSTRISADMIPAFADQSVITWGLRKSVGDTLFYRDESGRILRLKLMGGLANSIFQGSILISDSLLRQFYPSAAGSRVMLADGPSMLRDSILQALETTFREDGLTAIAATSRLDSFNAVENTYLSVFMLLGGLGIIIGTIGLGVVLLRNLSRRRQEIALYGAIGFGKKFVLKLIIAEHAFILVSGLLLGVIASLPGVWSAMHASACNFPWMFITVMLALILLNGLVWIYFPARKITGLDPLAGLREE
jgi:ABC-type lipoprotein release transport system permease subunit